MEILEQLRFLFIVLMAYLSYRQIHNQPLSIDYYASEDEQIEEELPQPSQPQEEQQQKQRIVEEIGEEEVVDAVEKEIVAADTLQSIDEHANIAGEVVDQLEEEVDQADEAEEDNADPAHLPKTKRIRKTRKRSLKRQQSACEPQTDSNSLIETI